MKVKIGDQLIGDGEECFVIAEIGINHNGDIDFAKKLIDIAQASGCNAVKFQKRTIDLVYTEEELQMYRPNPFGETNGDLKRGLEFGFDEYSEIDSYCRQKGIIWFVSCWDENSVDFIEFFDPPCYKIASASLTDEKLLMHVKSKGKPVILSTGMSTVDEIDRAVEILGDNLVILHCTSTYPTDNEEINLAVIPAFKERYNIPIGYSGHERGLTPTLLAVAFGAVAVERHITLDRTLWGSDHAASLEPEGLFRLIRDIRQVPVLRGDGRKLVYDREKPILTKLRRVHGNLNAAQV